MGNFNDDSGTSLSLVLMLTGYWELMDIHEACKHKFCVRFSAAKTKIIP